MSQPEVSIWRRPEACALLARMAREGHSASQIARALSDAGHPATRNAVIGRAGREGICIGSRDTSIAASAHQQSARQEERRLRAAESARKRALERAAARKAVAGAVPPAVRQMAPSLAPSPASSPVPRPAPAGGLLFIASGHDACRWPLQGRGLGLVICGAGQAAGRPYCMEHARLAYVPLTTRDVRPPADGLRARSSARAEREEDLVEILAGEAA